MNLLTRLRSVHQWFSYGTRRIQIGLSLAILNIVAAALVSWMSSDLLFLITAIIATSTILAIAAFYRWWVSPMTSVLTTSEASTRSTTTDPLSHPSQAIVGDSAAPPKLLPTDINAKDNQESPGTLDSANQAQRPVSPKGDAEKFLELYERIEGKDKVYASVVDELDKLIKRQQPPIKGLPARTITIARYLAIAKCYEQAAKKEHITQERFVSDSPELFQDRISDSTLEEARRTKRILFQAFKLDT